MFTKMLPFSVPGSCRVGSEHAGLVTARAWSWSSALSSYEGGCLSGQPAVLERSVQHAVGRQTASVCQASTHVHFILVLGLQGLQSPHQHTHMPGSSNSVATMLAWSWAAPGPAGPRLLGCRCQWSRTAAAGPGCTAGSQTASLPASAQQITGTPLDACTLCWVPILDVAHGATSQTMGTVCRWQHSFLTSP